MKNGTKQLPLFDQEEAKFREFHRDNPHVYEMWERFTFEAINKGYQHIGAAMVRERIRWETGITTTGSNYKISNMFTPYYARLFMKKHPEHEGFFRTRAAKADEEMDDIE
jgi:hypothetical protein